MIELHNGDTLEIMDKLIKKGVKVDAIICDPPFGSHNISWDIIIPFDEMWKRLNKLIKPNGAIVLFGTQPFTSLLIGSNIKGFKYTMVWKKSKCGSPLTAKYKPLTKHEDIMIFEQKGKRINYNPQMKVGKAYKRKFTPNKVNNMKYGIKGVETNNTGTRHPDTILDFPQKWRRQDQVHPTQKPIPLMEFLISSFSNEGETILDFTMGSGTTGIASKQLNRNFIGIELDKKYFDITKNRIDESILGSSLEKLEDVDNLDSFDEF